MTEIGSIFDIENLAFPVIRIILDKILAVGSQGDGVILSAA